MGEGFRRMRAYRRTAWSAGVLALVVLAGSPAGSAGSTTKPYTASIAPTAVAGGSSTTFTVTITNQADPQHLGSANLTAPAGFTITGATLGGPGTILPPAGPSVLRLRNLDLAPGASIGIAVTATAPCDGGTFTWGLQAKQANDFQGPPGNDFTTASVLTTTVSGCRLVFLAQPAPVEVGEKLTSSPFDPAGPPVTVAAVDDDGDVIADATGDVTVTLAPSPGALSGTTTQPLVAGVATFDDLSVGVTGPSFTLTAASPGYPDATSVEFAVAGEGILCVGVPTCSGSVSSPTTTATVLASSLAGGTTALGLTLLEGGFPAGVCGAFTPLGSGVTISVRPLPGLTEVTMRLDKAIVNAKPTPNGVSTFDLCIGTDRAFPTKSGAPNVVLDGRFWGVLPNCPRLVTSPCEASAKKNNAGDVILVAAIPAPWDPDVWMG
jgi:hypothetical protein